MTLLIDQIAEKVIQSAIEEGKLDNLPGKGKPVDFEDETFIPEELRACYRILKNSGYLPPELEDRNHALRLCDLINSVEATDTTIKDISNKLKTLELKMRLKGIDTRFIYQYLSKTK
ncbi:DnaJ family domain-containing protein [Vibrio salinus]|uniref:DnaJ family domain-containing protein n=1 Tax=Vibrio salinus TaxID=2899784 RepID=UPI001E32F96D|nr:DnaJ family domain-containing protein [Vibrio salinus]MCE0492580.1 DUF1992 domain-containing protein [Vibrio salinus]